MTEKCEEQIVDAFRHWGYLQADLDPFGRLKPQEHADLDQLSGEAAERARRQYCGTIGVEFMHIADLDRRRWIQERIESDPPQPDRRRILELLIRAELFEQFLQARYIGAKRFSLEGSTAFIPLVEEILDRAAENGAEQGLLAMSHRGRLNAIVNIVGKSPTDIFAGFEDVDPKSVLGGGDVKYHLGATGQYTTPDGKILNLHLVSNPSHLEAVDPVAMGRVRAKQMRFDSEGRAKVLGIIMHGDAAFAGQGIAAETLNLTQLKGYSVGGTLHVIVNNLIGFTTEPEELHSSRFASDVAKRLPIPIFHVNGEDPDAVVRVARLALEYRYAFWSDVVIDLIGYRRHGHSEVDDPTITQPLLYAKIKDHPTLWQSYAEKIEFDAEETEKLAEEVRSEYEAAQEKAGQVKKKPVLRKLPGYWARYRGGRYRSSYEVSSGLPGDEILEIADKLTRYAEGFHIHSKVQRLLEQRAEMGRGERPIDYGMAEALAFGSLLLEGIPVRLTGQDTRRGTFNQRHAVLIDTENAEEYVPLANLDNRQARFECYNSMLSELAVVGYEYGYTRDYPDALVLWEAQFGDFVNGAQIVIDQFISAGEDKWDLLSGLVLLLPHGYEGQGPEHSSARIERFLQLAAEDNIQVCQPSTAAQYFHLLRRQALMTWRKPLVVFTPKSMLRHPDSASAIERFSRDRFLPVRPERDIEEATRVIVCTGKIGHDLRDERRKRKDTSTAILFLDQLYPFPEEDLRRELQGHSKAAEILWVQEEPANMGALFYVLPTLERLAGGRPVRSIKRSSSASPSTGSAKAHAVEQRTLLTLAFTSGMTGQSAQEPAGAIPSKE